MTITYGDTTGGGPGIMMTQTSGARTPFPLYVDLDGAGEWRPLPILPFAVVGTTVAGVHGFAPSVVRPGESFELSVRAEDRFYNRATGDIPGSAVVVGGEVRASTEAGSEAITVVELALDEPGVYRTTLRSRDVEPQITGGANPILVVEDPEYGIYWGDTHGHSGYAEGIGTLDFFLQFARDDARLDFVTHSEHDTALDAGEWELMRAKSAEYDDPGRFIPYLGWEWTRHTRQGGGLQLYGHRHPAPGRLLLRPRSAVERRHGLVQSCLGRGLPFAVGACAVERSDLGTRASCPHPARSAGLR